MVEWKKIKTNTGDERFDYYVNNAGPHARAASFGWWLPNGTTWHTADSLEEAKQLAERAVWEEGER